MAGAAALLLALSATAAFAIRQEMLERDLIDGLRQGGYVLYLRHAQRFKGARETLSGESKPADFLDCAKQRNLTPEGHARAVLLGETLRDWRVKFDRVIANPLCRTRQTALLAFGRASLDPRLYDPQFVRGLLATPPRPGTNTVLVGSEAQLRDITGFQIEPAEFAVFRPDGRGGFTLMGRLPPDEWESD